MSDSPYRSFETITSADLDRLADVGLAEFERLFASGARSRIYKGRLRLLCLCQGAAQHFVHRDRGVQDFDVWGFFETHPEMPFPARARWEVDFGPSRFLANPESGFQGRKVDVIGRSMLLGNDPVQAVKAYLEGGRTRSAWELSQRPVIVLWPDAMRGMVIWLGKPDQGWKGEVK